MRSGCQAIPIDSGIVGSERGTCVNQPHCSLAGGPPRENNQGAWREEFLHSPRSAGDRRGTYSERLKELVVEPELTVEALKLSYIRKVKARRFKNALIATLLAYLLMVVAFFAVGRCAF